MFVNLQIKLVPIRQYDDKHEFETHMKQQHQPYIVCTLCDKSVHPAYYSKHYSACRKSDNDRIIDARKKQIIHLYNEVDVDNNESGDDDNDDGNSDGNETERTLDTCAYHNPLLRIESII